MKYLSIILIVMFLFFSCQQPQQQVTKKEVKEIIKAEGWILGRSGVDQKFFPLPTSTAFKFSFGSKLFADVTPSATQSASDWLIGKMYKENGYSDIGSIYFNQIHYLDIGTIVGIQKKLLVNVKTVLTAKANNSNSPDIHIRAKDSNSQWHRLNPTIVNSYEELLLTDSVGVLEWYADNTAPYQWDLINYGWVDIEIYGDYYIASGISY